MKKRPVGSQTVKEQHSALPDQAVPRALTSSRKGVTLGVPRGGQGAKRTEAARKIGQIEIPLVVEER